MSNFIGMKNIFLLWQKFRFWGLRGVFNKIFPEGRARKLKAWLSENAKNYPLLPKEGFTIIADFSRRDALMKTMRDIVIALHKLGFPYQTFNTAKDGYNELVGDTEIFTPISEFRILKYTHTLEMHMSIVPKSLHLSRWVIRFWEFDTGLLETFPNLQKDVGWIAMSDFNFEYFKSIAPVGVKVQKLLYPYRFTSCQLDASSIVRQRYNIPQDAFVVFYNFALGYSRKNPRAVVRAFSKFHEECPKAYLLLKVSFSAKYPKQYAMLLHDIASAKIESCTSILNMWLDDVEIMNVTNMCDVYCSLHRGEGFGLGIAEAMSLGKAVVVTDWSASKEFAKPDNSIGVPYRLQPPTPSTEDDGPDDFSMKAHVSQWAEADIDYAAASLKELFLNAPMRARLGKAAQQYISDAFSLDKFKISISELLKA